MSALLLLDSVIRHVAYTPIIKGIGQIADEFVDLLESEKVKMENDTHSTDPVNPRKLEPPHMDSICSHQEWIPKLDALLGVLRSHGMFSSPLSLASITPGIFRNLYSLFSTTSSRFSLLHQMMIQDVIHTMSRVFLNEQVHELFTTIGRCKLIANELSVRTSASVSLVASDEGEAIVREVISVFTSLGDHPAFHEAWWSNLTKNLTPVFASIARQGTMVHEIVRRLFGDGVIGQSPAKFINDPMSERAVGGTFLEEVLKTSPLYVTYESHSRFVRQLLAESRLDLLQQLPGIRGDTRLINIVTSVFLHNGSPITMPSLVDLHQRTTLPLPDAAIATSNADLDSTESSGISQPVRSDPIQLASKFPATSLFCLLQNNLSSTCNVMSSFLYHSSGLFPDLYHIFNDVVLLISTSVPLWNLIPCTPIVILRLPLLFSALYFLLEDRASLQSSHSSTSLQEDETSADRMHRILQSRAALQACIDPRFICTAFRERNQSATPQKSSIPSNPQFPSADASRQTFSTLESFYVYGLSSAQVDSETTVEKYHSREESSLFMDSLNTSVSEDVNAPFTKLRRGAYLSLQFLLANGSPEQLILLLRKHMRLLPFLLESMKRNEIGAHSSSPYTSPVTGFTSGVNFANVGGYAAMDPRSVTLPDAILLTTQRAERLITPVSLGIPGESESVISFPIFTTSTGSNSNYTRGTANAHCASHNNPQPDESNWLTAALEIASAIQQHIRRSPMSHINHDPFLSSPYNEPHSEPTSPKSHCIGKEVSSLQFLADLHSSTRNASLSSYPFLASCVPNITSTKSYAHVPSWCTSNFPTTAEAISISSVLEQRNTLESALALKMDISETTPTFGKERVETSYVYNSLDDPLESLISECIETIPFLGQCVEKWMKAMALYETKTSMTATRVPVDSNRFLGLCLVSLARKHMATSYLLLHAQIIPSISKMNDNQNNDCSPVHGTHIPFGSALFQLRTCRNLDLKKLIQCSKHYGEAVAALSRFLVQEAKKRIEDTFSKNIFFGALERRYVQGIEKALLSVSTTFNELHIPGTGMSKMIIRVIEEAFKQFTGDCEQMYFAMQQERVTSILEATSILGTIAGMLGPNFAAFVSSTVSTLLHLLTSTSQVTRALVKNNERSNPVQPVSLLFDSSTVPISSSERSVSSKKIALPSQAERLESTNLSFDSLKFLEDHSDLFQVFLKHAMNKYAYDPTAGTFSVYKFRSLEGSDELDDDNVEIDRAKTTSWSSHFFRLFLKPLSVIMSNRKSASIFTEQQGNTIHRAATLALKSVLESETIPQTFSIMNSDVLSKEPASIPTVFPPYYLKFAELYSLGSSLRLEHSISLEKVMQIMSKTNPLPKPINPVLSCATAQAPKDRHGTNVEIYAGQNESLHTVMSASKDRNLAVQTNGGAALSNRRVTSANQSSPSPTQLLQAQFIDSVLQPLQDIAPHAAAAALVHSSTLIDRIVHALDAFEPTQTFLVPPESHMERAELPTVAGNEVKKDTNDELVIRLNSRDQTISFRDALRIGKQTASKIVVFEPRIIGKGKQSQIDSFSTQDKFGIAASDDANFVGNSQFMSLHNSITSDLESVDSQLLLAPLLSIAFVRQILQQFELYHTCTSASALTSPTPSTVTAYALALFGNATPGQTTAGPAVSILLDLAAALRRTLHRCQNLTHLPLQSLAPSQLFSATAPTELANYLPVAPVIAAPTLTSERTTQLYLQYQTGLLQASREVSDALVRIMGIENVAVSCLSHKNINISLQSGGESNSAKGPTESRKGTGVIEDKEGAVLTDAKAAKKHRLMNKIRALAEFPIAETTSATMQRVESDIGNEKRTSPLSREAHAASTTSGSYASSFPIVYAPEDTYSRAMQDTSWLPPLARRTLRGDALNSIQFLSHARQFMHTAETSPSPESKFLDNLSVTQLQLFLQSIHSLRTSISRLVRHPGTQYPLLADTFHFLIPFFPGQLTHSWLLRILPNYLSLPTSLTVEDILNGGQKEKTDMKSLEGQGKNLNLASHNQIPISEQVLEGCYPEPVESHRSFISFLRTLRSTLSGKKSEGTESVEESVSREPKSIDSLRSSPSPQPNARKSHGDKPFSSSIALFMRNKRKAIKRERLGLIGLSASPGSIVYRDAVQYLAKRAHIIEKKFSTKHGKYSDSNVKGCSGYEYSKASRSALLPDQDNAGSQEDMKHILSLQKVLDSNERGTFARNDAENQLVFHVIRHNLVARLPFQQQKLVSHTLTCGLFMAALHTFLQLALPPMYLPSPGSLQNLSRGGAQSPQVKGEETLFPGGGVGSFMSTRFGDHVWPGVRSLLMANAVLISGLQCTLRSWISKLASNRAKFVPPPFGIHIPQDTKFTLQEALASVFHGHLPITSLIIETSTQVNKELGLLNDMDAGASRASASTTSSSSPRDLRIQFVTTNHTVQTQSISSLSPPLRLLLYAIQTVGMLSVPTVDVSRGSETELGDEEIKGDTIVKFTGKDQNGTNETTEDEKSRGEDSENVLPAVFGHGHTRILVYGSHLPGVNDIDSLVRKDGGEGTVDKKLVTDASGEISKSEKAVGHFGESMEPQNSGALAIAKAATNLIISDQLETKFETVEPLLKPYVHEIASFLCSIIRCGVYSYLLARMGCQLSQLPQVYSEPLSHVAGKPKTRPNDSQEPRDTSKTSPLKASSTKPSTGFASMFQKNLQKSLAVAPSISTESMKPEKSAPKETSKSTSPSTNIPPKSPWAQYVDLVHSICPPLLIENARRSLFLLYTHVDPVAVHAIAESHNLSVEKRFWIRDFPSFL